MGFAQQWTWPSPVLVQRTVAPQVEHWYRLPSSLGMAYPLWSIRLTSAGAAAGNRTARRCHPWSP